VLFGDSAVANETTLLHRFFYNFPSVVIVLFPQRCVKHSGSWRLKTVVFCTGINLRKSATRKSVKKRAGTCLAATPWTIAQSTAECALCTGPGPGSQPDTKEKG